MAWADVTGIIRSGGRRRRSEPLPDRLHALADDERLLPAIGELVAVGPGDGVFRRPKLAEEAQRVGGLGAREPEAHALFPPAGEEAEPFLVLGERDLHLDLLAAGDPGLDTVRAPEGVAEHGAVS